MLDTILLTREDMDKFKCENPDCDDDHELFLNSQCHHDSPIRALLSGDILDLRCAECDRTICHIAIEIGYSENVIIDRVKCECCDEMINNIYSKCHREYVDVHYAKKSGIISMMCYLCGRPVYEVLVK